MYLLVELSWMYFYRILIFTLWQQRFVLWKHFWRTILICPCFSCKAAHSFLLARVQSQSFTHTTETQALHDMVILIWKCTLATWPTIYPFSQMVIARIMLPSASYPIWAKHLTHIASYKCGWWSLGMFILDFTSASLPYSSWGYTCNWPPPPVEMRCKYEFNVICFGCLEKCYICPIH